MVENFSAVVGAWAAKSKNRMNAVIRQSVQDVIDDAQMTTAKGGRMHVDTGFLRASGAASLDGMPSGPVRADSKVPDFYAPDSGAIELTVAKFEVGKVFWFGWTANYARPREAKDAFLRIAAQKFQTFVTKNVAEAKRRFNQ